MKQFALPARSIPFDDSWDVIVLGGGPAGSAAATAAAREGAKTLLVEQTGSLGGMGTSGLVPAWTPFSDKQKIIYRGIAERVFEETKAGMKHIKPTDLDWVAIDPERLKRVYDQLVTEAGAKILFNTFLASVETDGHGAVRAVVLASKLGPVARAAKVYVDCTGDADLCTWAGAEFHKGDENGQGLMPATHCFALANVNTEAFSRLNCSSSLHPGNRESVIYKITQSGKYPLIPDVHLCSTITGPGTIGFNAGHVYNVDNTDPETVSPGLVLGRKIAAQYRDALAEYLPEVFGNCYLVMTGSLLGIRETRRVVGDYVLTLKDYLERKKFDDEICRNSYFIDVHAKVKEAFADLKSIEAWEKTTMHYGPGETHGIPYRCLTPKGLKNVLVAGRSISAEQVVQGSVRVMPCCLSMGEAAGMAAAHASATGGDVHAVNTDKLRSRLREEGAYLPKLPSEDMAAV
jgi:hypothetical protein